MGQSLKRAAQWTSAGEGTSGKLEFTPLNQDILNSILQFIESYSTQHIEESKVVFKTALSWETLLRPSTFTGPGYTERGSDIVSEETTVHGDPKLTLCEVNGSYTLSIYNLAYAVKVIALASEAKIKEVRACLEANRDPVVNICGDRFATVEGEDNSLSRYIEELVQDSLQLSLDADKEDTEGQTKEGQTKSNIKERQKLLNLRLQIARLDEQLLNMSVEKIAQDIRITPGMVDDEVKVIQSLSGPDVDKHVMREIKYYYIIDGYVYENSCRAPPWRQVHGDICYLSATPHDGPTIYITANTAGFFLNGGQLEGSSDLNYDKNGDYHKNLAALLKSMSTVFKDAIEKQDFSYKRKEAIENIQASTHHDDADSRSIPEQLLAKESEQEKSQKATTGERNRKLEPSLKWQNVMVEKKEFDMTKEEKKKSKKKRHANSVRKTSQLSMRITYEVEDSFSESSTESEEEDEGTERRSETNTDLPSEYWQIQKLVKYLKGGNQTATIISLCAMRDFNLDLETCQLAIRDVGGLEVLINLLDTAEVKCMIGSLKILKEISKNAQIRRSIADLGGLQTMVTILRHPNKELKSLAAETIANVSKFRRARRTVRQHGGIKKLVSLMDCGSLKETNPETILNIEVARCGALALWSCSKSKKNKETMRKAGAIPLLAKLLKSNHENMLVPVVGTLQECATEASYRLAIRTEGMVEDLVKNLHSQNHELQMHCASAIFKCAEDTETRDLVRRYGGLDPLVALLSNFEDKDLLAAATGAIWKCSISPENVERFQELRAIDLLVGLLNNQPEEVLVNVVGALGEMAKDTPNRLQIRKAGGIPPMVNLLTGTNQELLVNVTRAVGECAEEPDNMIVIDKLDGVRLLWSLLKNQNPRVQASAAWAICPCIENAKDAGEMVRSFVGGLELIVSLLKSEDMSVLASVCAAIANIAKDEENLAVITDHGVVTMLASLTNQPDDRWKQTLNHDDGAPNVHQSPKLDLHRPSQQNFLKSRNKLREHLAEAIARCCNWGSNRIAFGHEQAVSPLVRYLKCKDEHVHRSTARALFQLSKDPLNCITMHEAGVVKPLMEMVGSQDPDLQEAAAGCIGNIRRLALANEKAKYT